MHRICCISSVIRFMLKQFNWHVQPYLRKKPVKYEIGNCNIQLREVEKDVITHSRTSLKTKNRAREISFTFTRLASSRKCRCSQPFAYKPHRFQPARGLDT